MKLIKGIFVIIVNDMQMVQAQVFVQIGFTPNQIMSCGIISVECAWAKMPKKGVKGPGGFARSARLFVCGPEKKRAVAVL